MNTCTLALLLAVAAGFPVQDAARGSRTFAVVGRILDPSGKPLAGAVVLADNGGSYQVMKQWSETPWRNWVADPVGAASTGPFTRRAASATAADGRFRVDGVPLPAGEGWIVVVHPEFATSR